MKAIIVSNDVLSFRKVIRSIDTTNEIELIKTFSLMTDVENFVSNHDVDVIFVDTTSEKEEKISLIQSIRNQGKKIYVVLISDNKEDSYIAYNLHAIGFLLKPYNLEQASGQLECMKNMFPERKTKVEIKTFGNFSVLLNGKPLEFTLAKTKEIFAYLIYKQGTEVTWPTLAAEIFEEDMYDSRTYERVHKAVERLKKILKQYGIENILNINRGKLSINMDTVDCDLYKFIEGDKKAISSYFGEFMSEYSWAEDRASYLDRLIQK